MCYWPMASHIMLQIRIRKLSLSFAVLQIMSDNKIIMKSIYRKQSNRILSIATQLSLITSCQYVYSINMNIKVQ